MPGSSPTPSPPKEQGFVRAIDPDALKVVRRLLNAGHEAYLVGGCVRDLYLGLRPKDFDVATSATPEDIRRLFRNSRIIGRRFRLAHVFFGTKIIETSTFRTAPQASDGEDLLITQDNEWGSVEDDARRRDFTINGLFFDVETEKIVDFVDGIDDLESRLIRTIGDPVVRFQEDPVRMIRAAKFAARLDFDVEKETWAALLEVAPDIAKCSQARVLEEIYKLLRGGAARRAFALMVETGLLEALMPQYVRLYGDDVESGIAALEAAMDPDENDEDAGEPEEEFEDDSPLRSSMSPARLLWRYLTALDAYTSATRQVAVNGVLQAVLFAPLLSGDLSSAGRAELDRKIDELMQPVGAALGIARRDRDLARQILMAHRRMVEAPQRKKRRPSLASRHYFHDALIFLGITVYATGDGGSELSRWKRLAAAQRREPSGTDEGGRKRKRRGGRSRRSRKPGEGGSEARPAKAAEG
jgi:poly(A) polymerase